MYDYKTLIKTLNGFSEKSKHRPLSLGEAIDTLDETAYAFIGIILVLPFVQPVPLGPITVLGGVAFAVLGWQLLSGHGAPVLPQRIRSIEMSEKTWRILTKVCIKLTTICHKFTRPRLIHLVSGRRGQRVAGSIMLVGGVLMAIPFPIPLPGNNILPGLAILFYCIGELESDGLMVFFAIFWLLLTVIYFCAYFLVLWYFGSGALAFFK